MGGTGISGSSQDEEGEADRGKRPAEGKVGARLMRREELQMSAAAAAGERAGRNSGGCRHPDHPSDPDRPGRRPHAQTDKPRPPVQRALVMSGSSRLMHWSPHVAVL